MDTDLLILLATLQRGPAPCLFSAVGSSVAAIAKRALVSRETDCQDGQVVAVGKHVGCEPRRRDEARDAGESQEAR